MLLIWGFTVRYSTLDGGTFFCPHEGGDRPYERKQAKRWFTFFFIPMIPLNELGEFVECTGCKRGYDQQVLSNPTSAQLLDNLANAMRQAVVSIIRADGHIDDAEKDAAVEVMKHYSDTPYARQHLDHDLETLPEHGLVEHFTGCAGILNSHGKESLLAACAQLAIADGDVAPEELALLHEAGTALGMTKAHVNGVMDAVFTPERTQ